MNILDENIIASQRQRMRSWRVRVRQVGVDIARKGLQDEEIPPIFASPASADLLHAGSWFLSAGGLPPAVRYCLPGGSAEKVAIFVRRVLRHRRLNTQAKRLGTVMRVSHRGLGVMATPCPSRGGDSLGGLQGD